MKTFLPAITMMVFGQILSAQVSIDSVANAPRHGDELCRISVPYIAPGDGGTNQAWQLGQADRKNSRKQMNHHQEVVSKNDPNSVNQFIYIGK